MRRSAWCSLKNGQWRRERALIEADANKTIAELRATISELANETRAKALEAKPGVSRRTSGTDRGKLPIARRFEADKVHYEGDVVIYNGSTYQALRDTGHGVTHSDWIRIARAGRDGRDGITPAVRGTYDYREVLGSNGIDTIGPGDGNGCVGLRLRRHPLCKFCLERGIVTAANVVDRVIPHRGDWKAFVTGELQSSCEPCHKSAKRQIELHGYRTDVGLDG